MEALQSTRPPGFLLRFNNFSASLWTARESGEAISEYSDDGRYSYEVTDFWLLATADNLRQELGWSITMTIAYVIVFITGVTGNVLVLLVIIIKPPMRAVTNMFLFNLAVADLFVIIFCVPVNLIANLFTPWILGLIMCKGVAYIQGVSVCASAYSLAALSLDRCKAIYHPLEHQQGISKRQGLITILFIWIISSIVIFPWIFVFEVVRDNEDGHIYCIEVWNSEGMGKTYFVFGNLICCYLIPFLLICVSNFAIWLQVSKREVPKDSTIVKEVHTRTRENVRKTLSIVTSAFLISWLPLYAIATYVKFFGTGSTGGWVEYILSFASPCAQWLGSLNSIMNPILYAFINSKFRRGFQGLLHSMLTNSNYVSYHIDRFRQSRRIARSRNSRSTKVVHE